MKCYKITVNQNTYSITSSRKLMLKLMHEALRFFPKLPHKEIAVMYEETSTFPKVYYFSSSSPLLASKVIESCKAVEVDCPPYPDPTRRFQFLGNKYLFIKVD